MDPASLRAFCRKFLEDMPPLNYNAFVYLLSFLREVLAEEAFNRTTPALLAAVCVTHMTYPQPLPGDPALSREEKQRRSARQSYMQAVVAYLLSTTSTL